MPKLFTVGHSNRTFDEFLKILQAHDIQQLLDVRSIPRSRHVPWTNKDTLETSLKLAGISYEHNPALGGLRHAKVDSINTGWKNASFRGFADYMQTIEFYQALKNLNQKLKKNSHVVIMCAEALPWRCHRSLIADAEVIRRISVLHIIDAHHTQQHRLTPFAIVNPHKKPLQIYYPKEK